MEEYIASNGKKCLILNKINSKELAYVIGFISADASIDKINRVEISTSIKDKSIIEFISVFIRYYLLLTYFPLH